MRLVFAGTPAVAVPSLRALASGPHEIAAVVTRGDAPLGRKRVLTPSPVAQTAEKLGLPVIKADRLDADATARIATLQPQLGVIVAYGGLVREPLLSLPDRGWINLHFSLLPRWRGAAPVQRALIAGDAVTGASVFQLVAALDAGDVFAEERYEIPTGSTSADVLDALAEIGAPLLARIVDAIADGTAVAVPQEGEPTLAPKLTLEDGALDLTRDAVSLLHQIAGATPEPGAHTTFDGARFKVLRASASEAPPLPPGRVAASGKEVLVGTGTSPLRLETVQPAGKGAMNASDWFRGLRTDQPVLGA
ncbi:methionyl-tRNA formyltransferase [Microbacterium sp. ru370.1]|uniref:methionyl-tRNA formyltransferase n=1 Tax=unclassified Microbacterium TaxID=2609290 RepID=UPI00088F48C7|nr:MULTISPECIES: methionyl-tRNA formyltransferase [unclassified Microbacterium]SDO74730.1 methionyl-tRNA formyltransferase [Microbacterium sp. ru370.1]SIT88177.1 methionyl-tRNA formyltransferase [Microbacterium sp. RU1D]